MNSESKSDDGNGDTATKRVLDYCKKYSQNKELPKYFSGTSVSYLPIIKDEDRNASVTVPEINIHCDNVEKDVDTSRASSALSNRKLEWDNGADIGYENLQDIKVLRKSISLPVITDAGQCDPDFDMRQIAHHIDHARSEGSSDSNVKIILLSFSSSSDGQNPEVENVYSSSSSEPEGQKQISSLSSNTNSNPLSKHTDSSSPNSDESRKEKISQFASSLSYLKHKIGLPGAHSTPKYLEARKSDPELFSSTPVAQKPVKTKKLDEEVSKLGESSQVSLKDGIREKPQISKNLESIPVSISKEKKNTNGDSESHIITYKNSKVVNLAVTKPITVECTCSPKPKKSPQVVTKQTSVGIQTDTISERELVQIIKKSEEDHKNQSLIFFNSESDKTNCSTQTGSDMASRCDSFEFYKNSGRKSKTPSSDSGSEKEKSVSEPPENPVSTVEVQNGENNLKRSQKTADLTRENSNQSSLNDICLGNLISATQLDNDGDGVEKSFHLLYKLLKSKKYDAVTKKRYIKKIMEKITDSKYLEESSTSSDLFCPKKSKVIDLKPPKPVSTDTSDEKRQKNTLQLNLPLYLALTEKPKISPRKRRLGVKTFIQDFLPSQSQSSRDDNSSPPEIIPCDLKDTKKNCFTLTNNEFSVNREHLNEEPAKTGEMEADKSSYDTEISLEKQYESSSTGKSLNYQNWREDKTVSEKLLEEKSGTSYGEGDCLVKFAEKERAYQINWINNEISHLGKLKGLLEKPALSLPNVKKTTTVYTVSEDHACTATKGVKFQRNYVIETHLGTDTTQPMSFNFKGKRYTVDDLTAKPLQGDRKARKVVGDIEVASSGSTTSIKVSTFCETCRRSPCICICVKCKKSPCACNIVKPSVCQYCHTIPCICRNPSTSRHHPHCLLDETVCWRCNKNPCECPSPSTVSTLSGKTICLVCHRTPCVCSRAGSIRGILSKTCLSCGKYPCVYGKSRTSTISDEFTGTFVVARPPKSAIGGANMRKWFTFPLTSKDESERKHHAKCSACEKYPCVCESSSKGSSKCTVCGKCPCVCDMPKKTSIKALEICEPCKPSSKIEKKCSICGRTPCVCETIKREYLNRGTSISSKSLEKCLVCGKHPCVCKILKLTTKSCTVCKRSPCVCDTVRRDYITKATSVSHKSLENCALCRTFPCICDLLKKNVDTKGTSISIKSLGICSACGKSPCICEELSKTSSSLKNSSESCSGSLKKVFENCNCSTQTSCTCDFVEKLMQRFNKADVPSSTVIKECKSSSLQTDDTNKCNCQNVGIQTQVDIRHQNLQAGICAMGDVENKISQTERCCQTIGIQTQTETFHLSLQTSKAGCNEEEATQVEIVSCNEEDKVKTVTFTDKLKSPRPCRKKVDAGISCEVAHGTQTLGDRRVMLTCSSQSDGSRTVSPVERTHSAGISRKRHKQTSCVANKRCTCCPDGRDMKTPVITEEYDSKTESLESDTRYLVSSKSSSVMTSSCNGTTESVSDPSSSKASSLVTCICCKVKFPPEKISMLGSSNQNFPLCKYCLQRRPILTSLCYAGPEHVCTCFKPVRNDVVHEIKKTVSELYNLEFCSCSTPTRSKNSNYCSHCQMKLKNTAKTKNGIAYTLTLEDKTPCTVKCKRKRRRPSLEEIRIKVPCPYTRKEHKDKVNLCRQDGDKEGVAVEYVERISSDCDNKKGPRVKVICSKTKRSRRTNLTLQDYLKKNKPDFIGTAEYRRQALYSSRSERELKKDEAKLRFFEDNKCKCKLKKENTKVFTEQEMKAITKRNYAKLPEVQQKHNEQREQRLRNADKFIVDVFSTKIRNCALRGKKDFPLSQNIVSLPKA